MKTFVVRTVSQGVYNNLRIDADGYVVGPSGEVHFLKERFGQPPSPFIVFASGKWEMVAEAPPTPQPDLDTSDTIVEASN